MSKYQKYRNSMFTRMILSYTLMTVVLIGLAGGYLYSRASGLMIEEMSKDSEQRLQSVRDYIENTVLRNFENHIENIALSTGFASNEANLNYLLESGWQGNQSKISMFSKRMGYYAMMKEGVYNTTVYMIKGNYVVDKNYFYMTPANSADASFIESLEPGLHNRWLARELADGQKVLSYVVKLPYNQPSVEPKGYMYLDVTAAHLAELVTQISASPHERFYVFDSLQEPIIISGDGNSEYTELVRQAMNDNASFTDIQMNDRQDAIISHVSPQNSQLGWSYAIIRPVKSFSLAFETFKNNIFIVCIAVLLLGLVISYLFSKQLYMPMKKLVNLVKHSYSPQQSASQGNEYAFIGNALNNMVEKITYLEGSVKENEMRNLVLGVNLNLEHSGYLPQELSFIVAYIRVSGGDTLHFSEQYRRQAGARRYDVVYLTTEEAAVIYYIHANEAAAELPIREELQQFAAESEQTLTFGAAIGTIVHSIDEIPISYQYALHAYRYRFIHGPDAIIAYDEISSLEAAPHMFSFDQYINALKAGDHEQATKFLDDYAAKLTSGQQKLEAVELSLLQLVSSLYQAVIDLKLQEAVQPSSLFDELKKESLAETISAIRNHSERVISHIKETSSHAHTDMILQLKTFIDEHLHEELSLNVLSDRAGLAPAYISTLFGEVMKESFTEYVTRSRLDKAASILREDSRMPVAEISALVGYRNPQYFHNKFKMKFGITPIQYRNVWKNTPSAQ
jgi:two-component system response regulator YesN